MEHTILDEGNRAVLNKLRSSLLEMINDNH